MALSRPQSRKLRALQATLGQTTEQIAATYAPSPKTYAEIAAEWQEKVAERFPELGLQFGPNDVYLLFRAAGIRRTGLTNRPAEAAA